MKRKNFTLACLIAVASFALFIVACKKDSSTPDTDTSESTDNSMAEKTYSDVNDIADEAGTTGSLSTFRTGNNSSQNGLLSSCATITNDTTVSPHVLTIDFGATNCTCNDGKTRRGKIIVSYSGHYRDSASTHTITFSNYYVNDYKVDGTKKVTNTGHNSSGNLVFNISVTGTITNTSGKTMTWTSTRQREWIAGESTIFNWTDDVYSITGSASGTSFSGISFTATITDPLIVALDCRWIKQGKFEFKPSGKATRYFDYGTTGCDNKATVTINGTVYNITL